MVWEPPAPVESESVTPFRFVKASRASVPDVAASETVIEEFVTVGTVYDAITVWLPLFDVDSVIVMPFDAVNANRPTVAEVAESETVHDVIVGTVYDPMTV
jgi:hypothetical protein